MMCDFAEQPSFAKSQGERCWHGARALMSGVWNSFAVSSDALCRPPLSTFCPVSGLGAAPFAPSLASLACYNEVGIPGMWEYIFPYTPPQLPTSNLLSTFWVSFKHSQSDSFPHPTIHSPHTHTHSPASCIASLSHIPFCPPGVPLTRLKPPTSVLLPASLQGYLSCSFLTFSWDMVPFTGR